MRHEADRELRPSRNPLSLTLLRPLHWLAIQALRIQEGIVNRKLGNLQAFKYPSWINPQWLSEVVTVQRKSGSFETAANHRNDRALVES
jgi:hypothetical protein